MIYKETPSSKTEGSNLDKKFKSQHRNIDEYYEREVIEKAG